MTSSRPGMPSHGMPPRPGDTERTLRDLQRQINEQHGMIVQAVQLAQASILVGSQTNSNVTWSSPGSLISRASIGFTVPSGRTQAAVSVTSTCATTFASGSTGIINTQPSASFTSNGSPITVSGFTASNSSGTATGAVLSAASPWHLHLYGLNPGDTFTIETLGSRIGTAATTADDGYVSALAVFYP